MDNPDVKIFSVMYDEYQPYSCLAWVAAGTAEIPILVDDGETSGDMELLSLFFDYSETPLTMPNSVFLKFYHWIINGKDGYSPGKIALSGFNYADEKHNNGFGQHEWLSGGAILHQKKNIIFKNYYFFNYSKCFCEDILHSLKLSEKSIKLIKLYSAVAFAKESGSIVKRRSLTTTLINFLSELNVRFYIVKNYNKSYIRFVLYYFILMLRIILKMLFGKR